MAPPTTNRRGSLKIHATPFKPSRLSQPPSPMTPLTPLLPQRYPKTEPGKSTSSRTLPAPDPSFEAPPSPLQWLWQCHQCNRTYALGVTRRCLEDGHTFCSGTTTVKDWRRNLNPRRRRDQWGSIRRHKACGSEFDYQGWKTWGRWRRSGKGSAYLVDGDEDDCDLSDSVSTASSSSDSLSSSSSFSSSSSENDENADIKRAYLDSNLSSPELSSQSPRSRASSQGTLHSHKINALSEPKKDCWNNCDYPSECRWGRRYGIHTPLSAAFPPSATLSPTTTQQGVPTAAGSLEGILKPENVHNATSTCPASGSPKKEKEKTDFWGALVASATRRKSIPPSSPLANIAEEVPSPATDEVKDRDGDIVMSDSDSGPAEKQALNRSLSVDANMPSTVNPSQLTITEAITTSIVESAPVVTMKEIIKKTSKKAKTSHSKSGSVIDRETQKTDRKSPVVGATALESVVEEATEAGEMEPLSRVASRDSGYASVEGVGRVKA